jgi:hypothetical protein
MATEEQIRYELSPRAINRGRNWLTVALENLGMDVLRGLHVRVNTLDVYSVEVLTEDAFVPVLDPDAKEVVPVQISANVSGSVYITVDGKRGGEAFHWESPDITLTVEDESAELVSLLALTEPEPTAGDMIRCEATLRGRVRSEGLKLEFWAQTPGGEFEELAILETKALSPGEEARYVAEIEAGEIGRYTIYAYPFDGTTRIGRVVETIRVGEP